MIGWVAKTFLRLVVALLSGGVMLATALLLILFLLLMTERGRVFVVEQGSVVVTQLSPISVEVEAIRSPTIGTWQFGKLGVSQEETPLVSAEGVEVIWSPSEVLRRLDVQRLAADEIRLTIPPPTEEDDTEDDDAEEQPFQLPQWNYPIALQEIDIQRLIIHDPARERTQRFQIVGRVLVLAADAPLKVDAAIESLDEPKMQVAIATKGGEDNQWQINARLQEAAGGMIGSMLRLPAEQALAANLTVDLQPAPEEKGSWQVNIAPLESQYGNYPLALTAQTQIWPEAQRVQVREAVLTIDGAEQTFSGEVSPQNLEMNAKLEAFPLSLVGEITQQALSGTASGQVEVTGTPQKPVVAATLKADGAFDRRDFTALADFRYHTAMLALQVNKATLSMFDASLNASGTLQENVMDFTIRADDIPTSITDMMGWHIYPGFVSINADITGTFADPGIKGSARYESQISQQTRRGKRRTVAVQADFATQEQWFTTNFDVQQNGENVGELGIRLPKDLPQRWSKEESVALAGKITANMELSDLKFLFNPLQHDVKGRLKADVSLGGTATAPALTGEVTLNDGYYENRMLGLTLDALTFALQLSGTQMRIAEASATDGDKGSLSLDGQVNWDVLNNNDRVDVRLAFKDMNLVQRHDIEAFSTGNLSLDGDFSEMTLAGKVEISPLTILLDTLTQGADIPEIDVTDIYGQQPGKGQGETGSGMPVVNLDVMITTQNQAYLRGYGLDAELEGEVEIDGTAQEPKVVGSLQTTRGFYSLLGKRFRLGEGRVEFQNSDVWFSIPGTYNRKGREIRAVISGTVDDLDISLSSNPAMPEDEIVSWLLFGKSAGNISPFQAIRLANAVAAMRGGNNAIFDPVGLARDVLNVDTISIDTEGGDSGEDVSVGVGKYINDRVYLELGKGADPAQPVQGKLEIELLPNLNLESNTASGEEGVGNVKLQWKRDY